MSGKSYLLNKNFHKHNYFDAFKYIVPEYVYEDDRKHSPKSDDLADVIINSNISLANDINNVISISAIPGSTSENLNNISGIAPYFVKQNKLTDITTQDFEDNILYPTNRDLKKFTTVEDFSGYVVSTLLPSITLNNPAGFSSTDTSNSHNYLVTNLSWLYFLNTSGANFDPSSYVADLMVNKLFKGQRVTTADGIKGLMEFVWKNELTTRYPSSYFASGTRADLSGVQQLDKLKTWVDIIYSPLFADNSDFRVRDKFETFIDSNIQTSRKVEDGPFVRFLRALSFLAYDIDNLSEKLTTLYDLEDCPDEFLPLLAKLVGWDLFGADPDRWRLQLRNATDIYKAVGTKKAIQFSLNTVFPKDQFPIQASLVELWESYVPYLIYYSLATESRYFEDFTTWTPDKAIAMGVSGYTTSGMDYNLRRATDRIINEVYEEFPDSFNIPNQENKFYYRGQLNDIPPFEEYPYYVNVELNKDMIDFISDRLVCFGVRNDFAIQVSSYLTEYGLDSNDEPRDGSWLLFTSGYNDPPNFSRMVELSNNKKLEYLSLWSGKSSHFKLAVNASSYDFTKKGLITVDTGDAVAVASDMIRKFAPAHSIPLISLEVSGDYDPLQLSEEHLPLVMFNLAERDAGANGNYWLSGLTFNTYMRGLRSEGRVLKKGDTQSSVSPALLYDATKVGNLERRSARRRSFKNVMPHHGYYDRTGFNMPTTFEMDLSAVSGLPLGLIPSKGTFVPVSSHINLPAVWKQCEDLTSKNSYNDYSVSNTMAARGHTFYASSVWNDRGKLADIYATMHDIAEREKVARFLAESGPPAIENEIAILLESGNLDQYGQESLEALLDQLTLYPSSFWTNQVIELSNSNSEKYKFPASVNDYYNFEFGRDLHRLYRIYTEEFKQHRLSPIELTLDGPNILSHTLGPLLYNHDFDLLFNDSDISGIVTSSLSDVKELKSGAQPFTTASSYAASTLTDMYVEVPELVFSSLVKGVEFIHTSGFADSDESSFSVFRVDSNVLSPGDDPYMFDRTFILTKASRFATPRVRMDISKWNAGSDYPFEYNFLLPDHDYQLDLMALVGDDTGLNLGGRDIGVWIHTKPEQGKMWSYTPDGDWYQHSAIPTRQNMLNEYAHRFTYPTRTKPVVPQGRNDFKCLDVVAQEIKSPVTKYRQEDFMDCRVRFNTRNRKLLEPVEYKQTVGDLHRKSQQYVVEIFMVPGLEDTDRFLAFDKVEVKDLTLEKLSQRHVTGPVQDPLQGLDLPTQQGVETRLPLTKENLMIIFKFFNKLSGKGQTTSLASRDKSKTEAIMGSEGGSRLTYRYLVDMFARTNYGGVTPTLETLIIDA